MESQSSENRPSLRDSYRAGLGKTFGRYLKNEIDGKPSNILSVGCHFGYEAEPLLRIFPTAEYVGIDIDKKILEAAKRVNYDLIRVKFKVGDARRKEIFGKTPWDIIVVRNPQVLGTYVEKGELDKDWYIILTNCMKSLKWGGAMFISTPSEHEKDRVVLYINSSEDKMKIVANSRNEFSTSVGTFRDEFVIVAKKLGN